MGRVIGACAITLYRVYEEYYLPERRMDKLQKIRSQLASDDFDEVDSGDNRSRRSRSSETVEHDG